MTDQPEVTPADILEVARAVIEDPKRWTVGVYQRGYGENTRFCAIGGVTKAAHLLGGVAYWMPSSPYVAARYLLNDASQELYETDPAGVNDGGGSPRVPVSRRARHSAVLRVFDKAIEMARVEDSDAV